MKCEYGCNQKANFKFKNGKFCCSSNQMQCPVIIKKFKKTYTPSENPSFKKISCKYCKKEFYIVNIKKHEKSCYLNPINLKICPVCENPIKNQHNRFCSIKCATFNRSHSEESKQKISENIKLAYRHGKFKNKGIKYISKERRKEINENARIGWEKKFKNLSWGKLPLTRKRRRVLEEQNGKCAICKIDKWQGNSLTLHFDHIDGNKNNGSRKNVRFICPNCHSQTKTYCGNKQKLPQFKHLKITKERLTEA